jgi:hypothetical protein
LSREDKGVKESPTSDACFDSLLCVAPLLLADTRWPRQTILKRAIALERSPAYPSSFTSLTGAVTITSEDEGLWLWFHNAEDNEGEAESGQHRQPHNAMLAHLNQKNWSGRR